MLYDGGDADDSAVQSDEPAPQAPEGCTVILVGASSEKARLLADMADEFNASNADADADA